MPYVSSLWSSVETLPPQYLLERKWSRAKAIQLISGVHWWQFPSTDDWGADEDWCCAVPCTYKKGKTGWRSECWEVFWLQWPWDGGGQGSNGGNKAKSCTVLSCMRTLYPFQKSWKNPMIGSLGKLGDFQ